MRLSLIVVDRVRPPPDAEPQLAIPRADAIARLGLAHAERQHALRPLRGRRVCIRDELRGAAEFAVLRLARRVEHRDRVAALALDLALRNPRSKRTGGPGRLRVQRREEIVFGDFALRIERRGRLGAAEWTDELALRGIPDGLAAARGAGVLREGDVLRQGA